MPAIFGVRHLSPAGAWHLRRLLDETQPDLVLVEGPEDLGGLMDSICMQKTKMPIAMMAYSQTVPVRTILYPLAEYSPEYQAILWAHQNGKACRFIDLPSSVFLAMQAIEEERHAAEEMQQENEDTPQNCTEAPQSAADSQDGIDVYTALPALTGESDMETWWERHLEHNLEPNVYHAAAAEYGRQLRAVSRDGKNEWARNIVREAYMKRQIEAAVKEGFDDGKMVVVTGAFHVAGLESCTAMTDAEASSLPHCESLYTLMPYSYYRLSSLSGYGAGNKAPAYYEMLWDAMQKSDLQQVPYRYLTEIAAEQRRGGNMTSSAEAIEAVRLAYTLAGLQGGGVPTLQDLRDSAVTCIGHGHFAELSVAAAQVEVGTRIGSLPQGVSRTSVQDDFYRLLKDLRLEKYKAVTAQVLDLDLRENTRVKSEKAAFLDLERSFFLHRVETLGIHFVKRMARRQDKATWAEQWELQWTPEAEIEIVECALKGDTIELAAAFVFHERLKACATIADTAVIIEESCFCGMPSVVKNATSVLQGHAVDAASVPELAATAASLSSVVRYGNIRRVDPGPLLPLLQQLFYRACLILPGACECNNAAVGEIAEAMIVLDSISLCHEEVNTEYWLSVLKDLSERDNLNTKASGLATAILLERGEMNSDMLAVEVQRRLSRGIPADLGAGWFEGLSMKNKYALIARLSLWEQLSDYMDTLEEEEFRRALVFLRRAFSEFSATERGQIAENLGEIWQINPQQVGELLGGALTETEQQTLSELEEFDFDI